MNYAVPVINVIALITVFMLSFTKRGRVFSYASFTAGMFQVMYIFMIFVYVFRYTGSVDYTYMPASVNTILIMDAVFLNLYIIIYHILLRKMKIQYTGDMLFSDFLQIFIPPILLNTSLIFIVRMDIAVNITIYNMLISTNFVIMLFKSVFVLCNLLLGYIITGGNVQNTNESGMNS